jgi:hypothetical protein
MKKIILIAVALILLVTGVTSIVAAQDNPPSQQSVRLENALNQQLEQALRNGLIDQELVDRIKEQWLDKSEEEQVKLYERVVNMFRSKQRQARLENAFIETLEKAIALGYIEPEKYGDIIDLWEQKSPDEQQKLYERILNLLDTKSR